MKKGFTLVELLAVIVILAVIALIATPMILGVIETARKGAAESSALGYIDAIEKQIIMSEVSGNTSLSDGVYDLPMEGISVKGEVPSEGWVVIENSQVTKYSMKIMDYNVTLENGQINITKGETEVIIEAESVVISGADELLGRAIQLKATVLPENTTNKTVIWTSSNEEIANVNSNGLVSGRSNGTVTITAITSNGKKITKEITVSMPVCIRSLELHTETCTQNDSVYYCRNGINSTITYGNIGTMGEDLKSGDALDCDVNGDGIYDAETERFYYVTDLETNSEYAVLIYYNNTSVDSEGNIQSDNTSNSLIAYDTSVQNWHGPATAIANLPTVNDWNKVSLSNIERAILTETGTNATLGGDLPTAFRYEKDVNGEIIPLAARLLTVREINSACNITVGSMSSGELNNCNYLMENTKYSSSTLGTYGYWLENPRASYSKNVWNVSGKLRGVNNKRVETIEENGIRPVIEVPKTKILY